jgi:hypothetical protein
VKSVPRVGARSVSGGTQHADVAEQAGDKDGGRIPSTDDADCPDGRTIQWEHYRTNNQTDVTPSGLCVPLPPSQSVPSTRVPPCADDSGSARMVRKFQGPCRYALVVLLSDVPIKKSIKRYDGGWNTSRMMKNY